MSLSILKGAKNEILYFDYDQIKDKDGRTELMEAALVIKPMMRQTVENIIKIGEILVDVKVYVGHGLWGEWLSTEFELSDQQARRFMHVWESFGHLLGDKSNKLLSLSPSILYELAAPGTPQEVVEEIEKRVENDEPVRVKDVQELKREAADSKSREERDLEVVEYEQHIKMEVPEGEEPATVESMKRDMIEKINAALMRFSPKMEDDFYNLCGSHALSEAGQRLREAREELEKVIEFK